MSDYIQPAIKGGFVGLGFGFLGKRYSEWKKGKYYQRRLGAPQTKFKTI